MRNEPPMGGCEPSVRVGRQMEAEREGCVIPCMACAYLMNARPFFTTSVHIRSLSVHIRYPSVIRPHPSMSAIQSILRGAVWAESLPQIIRIAHLQAV
jgi:hypothetical protein